MEKLKPLLKHKFWIIGGVVLILTLVGWWIGTSAKAAYIEQRWQALSALNVVSGSNTPNDDYIKEIDAVIKVLDKRQDELDKELYDSQKSLHTWPKSVAKYMDGKQFRDPPTNMNVLQIYAREHVLEFTEMLQQIPRFYWDNEGGEHGIVYIEKDSDIPHVPLSTWKDSSVGPTNDVMWNTQEDIWLTRSILAAIRQVNQDAGATKISDAPIKQIVSLKFRGGTRDAGGAAGAMGSMGAMGGDSGGGYGEGMANYGDYGNEGSGSGSGSDGYGEGNYGGNYGGTGANDFALNKALKVSLDEVFGPETVQAAATGEGSSSDGGTPMGGSGYAAGPKKRYVDDDPALPYRTRGFYIELMMLHDRLPELQASLVSMPWPTELLLIQQASEQEDIIRPVLQEQKPTRPGSFNRGQQGGAFGRGSQGFGARPFGPQGRPQFGGAGRGGAGAMSSGQYGSRPQFGGGASRGGMAGFNPMGSRAYGPMGTEDMGNMGNMGNMGQGYGASNYQSQEDTTAFGKAMRDPYLMKVGIAGLMTIYRSPQEIAKSKGQEQAAPVLQTELPAPAEGQPAEGQPTEGQPAEGQPTEGQPKEQGTQPVDPNAKAPAVEGTQPMPGEPKTEPMPGQTNPAAPKTETKATETAPMEPAKEAAPPATENPANGPESPAPMNSEPKTPEPPKGESTPQETPPQNAPQNPNS